MTLTINFRTAIPAYFAETSDDKTQALAQRCIKHLDKFANIPGIITKRPKLMPYAPLGPGILSFFETHGYLHHDGNDETYNYTNLLFWGLICVTLLNPDTKTRLLGGLISAGPDLPRWPEQKHILHRCLAAMHPNGATGDAQFDMVAAQLTDDCNQMLSECDASQWAAQIGIKTNSFDWAVVIIVPRSDSPGRGLRLTLHPNVKDSWYVSIETAGGGRYSETPSSVNQFRLRLPPLKDQGLVNFGAWLAKLGQHHDLPYDLHRATIQTTKLRAAAKPIKAWLST